ncbi:hypothetical protein [Streptomyces sp. NPDC002640]
MEELGEVKGQLARLDDPTVGLTALHGELTQSRLKILEQVQGGVTGLREENREVRRRQDRMINDLHETRGELRQLLDHLQALRTAASTSATVGGPGEGEQEGPRETVPPAEAGTATGVTADPADIQPPVASDTYAQGETMENGEHRPQHETAETGKRDLNLKNAIEAAYRGTDAVAGQPPVAAPQAPAGAEDPRIAHGVLLLKAAGVASAELIAHRDTWEWLTARAVGHGHFRTPPAVEDFKEGRVRTVLSGCSLIALLIELWNTRDNASPLQGDWALAITTYNRIADELTEVTGQGQTIRIVLDDGLPHDAAD